MRAQAVTFFPTKQKAPNRRRPAIGFKAPPDIEEYLETLRARGYGNSEACINLIRIARDAEREAGDLYPKIEALARAEGVSLGQMLGRLAAQAASSTKSKK